MCKVRPIPLLLVVSYHALIMSSFCSNTVQNFVGIHPDHPKDGSEKEGQLLLLRV